MPIVSNASNKQMNVGKIQIKGGGVRYPPPLFVMVPYHGILQRVTSLAPVTPILSGE